MSLTSGHMSTVTVALDDKSMGSLPTGVSGSGLEVSSLVQAAIRRAAKIRNELLAWSTPEEGIGHTLSCGIGSKRGQFRVLRGGWTA